MSWRSSSGYSAMKSASTGPSRRVPNDIGALTRNNPRGADWSCATAWSAASISERITTARSKYCWPFSVGLACLVVRFRSCTPRLSSRSAMYLLIAERDSRNWRPASAKLPLSTTFTKARRLATLSKGPHRRLFPNRRHSRHICMDCLQSKAERYLWAEQDRSTSTGEKDMSGLHHVTAIAGDPIRNFGFYTRDLGLRFVKKTVNFDDPGTYHFYYGDETGRPGTILTFFPWAGVPGGRRGVGETHQTAFRVPQSSLGYWTQRFVEKGIAYEALEKRFGESVLPFTDPDGMNLALVGISGAENEPGWSDGEVPAEHAIRGFHGVTLLLDSATKTAAILTGVLGFTETAREASVIRFKTNGHSNGGVVDIYEAGGFLPGRQGAGSVHHIAFRARDDAEQARMAATLLDQHGLHPTEQKDRNYFRSIYFREPGGILFEIATDIPGFAVDEPAATLGRDLKLPKFLEARRKDIEAVLPPLGKVA